MGLLPATLCMQICTSFTRGFFPVLLIRMVYEANPAAISHQTSYSGCLYIMLFGNHRFRSLLVPLYPEAAKLKIVTGRTILHYAAAER
jgi:hypothetical protein